MSVFADIRNSTCTLLQGESIANGNIFNSKVTPTFLKNTPAVMVQNDKIQATQISAAINPAFSSAVNLQIVAVVSMTATWADEVDQLITDIINTLMTNTTWVGQFSSIDGYTVDYSFIGDQQSPLGAATISIIGRVFQGY